MIWICFGVITSPPLALYEPSSWSLLIPTVSPSHDASASVAIAVMIYLVMVVVGCEFGSFLAEGEPSKGAHCPVDDAAFDGAHIVEFHCQQQKRVCPPA